MSDKEPPPPLSWLIPSASFLDQKTRTLRGLPLDLVAHWYGFVDFPAFAASLPDGATVADIGFGRTLTAEALCRERVDLRAVAIDLLLGSVPDPRGAVRKAVSKHGLDRLAYVAGDAADLPLAKGKITVARNDYIAANISEPAARSTAREIRRYRADMILHLRQHGRLVETLGGANADAQTRDVLQRPRRQRAVERHLG